MTSGSGAAAGETPPSDPAAPRWVALLRAVNVGGRRLSMPELAAAFAGAGCQDVTTYVQSGNVVFTAPLGLADAGPAVRGRPLGGAAAQAGGPPPGPVPARAGEGAEPPPAGPLPAPGSLRADPPPEVVRALGEHLERAIEAKAGFAVPVLLRSAGQLRAVLSANPFVVDDPTKLHVAFLAGRPTAEAVEAFSRAASPPEDFALLGPHLYLHLPAGLGRAKLPQALGRLRVAPTVRNWRTVTKLAELAGA